MILLQIKKNINKDDVIYCIADYLLLFYYFIISEQKV
jgi:hypothetical protein